MKVIPNKSTMVLLLGSIVTINSYCQKFSTQIDTTYYSPDSTVIFVQNFIDTLLHQSYYGSWTGLITSEEYRCGKLRLRKCISTTEHLSHIWDKKKFSIPEDTFNGCHPIGEPAIISTRRKK